MWPTALTAEAPFLRAYVEDDSGVAIPRLQAALTKKLSAKNTSAEKTAWKQVAEQNHLASLANLQLGEPTWACSGPRFWAAITPGTHETADVIMGFRSEPGTEPPQVADLARFGPQTLAAIFREYGAFYRGSPRITIQMLEGGRKAEMTMTLPQWRGVLWEKGVLTAPGAVLTNGIGGGLALYAKYRDLLEALAFFGIAVCVALIAWLVAAKVSAGGKPRWERGGWEVG